MRKVKIIVTTEIFKTVTTESQCQCIQTLMNTANCKVDMRGVTWETHTPRKTSSKSNCGTD